MLHYTVNKDWKLCDCEILPYLKSKLNYVLSFYLEHQEETGEILDKLAEPTYSYINASHLLQQVCTYCHNTVK